ncbi:NAD-dependent deacetylase [Oryzisolibacter propanilivorax]|uniref:NAD-dependent protein deacylase n=1 Tax=Oryzisolibacter propanilivorax TaxID=1527607 RepID=A0A1G9SUJ7_9BURK|nr:NAD-dependent protein deacylase [Oryzisolibacter propanilivorax]SDM39093.1 NAD-dependent deacetylase [Oryzisolibacter propanilivorax]
MSAAAERHAVRDWIAQAGRVAVLTGAGMSAESGVPTFRDAQTGYWAQFNPQDMASERGFRAAPQRVWDWYAHRRAGVAAVQPNAGHKALADFARRHPGRLTLITQNVDGLHQRAGSPDVLCLHGDLLADRWLDAPRACCRLNQPEPGSPPRCARCGNLVRPGVVWFGENLPADVLDAAQQAAQAAELMLVVGTAGAVYPAAGLAHLARQAGARVVVLNPAESELDSAAHTVLRGTAARLLPELLQGV